MPRVLRIYFITAPKNFEPISLTLINLIARVKSDVVKKKERKELFAAIGYPPQLIVTHWASWLNAAFYHADNLPEVKRIVGEFQGDGLLVTRAKEAIASEHLVKDLLSIDRN